MTRVLSELLEAREPAFQQSLAQLESIAGHPRTDIRLSTEVQHGMRAKTHELGLDGRDTTARELYAVLGERLKADETRFRARIGADGREDIMQQVVRALQGPHEPRTCFALKATVAKRLFKAQLPRRTMKALGYRSADSMCKHESAAALYAAASLVETDAWTKRLLASFSKLKASDFELREIALEHPTSKRWQDLSGQAAARTHQYVLSFKELGSIVILPLPAVQPQLSALTTATLILHAVNEIRAASSYLRLHQMRTGFGGLVHQVVLDPPSFSTDVLGAPVSWEMLHQFFARLQHSVHASLFEPLLAREELAHVDVERALAEIEPSLEFWRQTAHIGQRDAHGQAASCNLTDALLSHANGLPFERRITQYFKHALHSELLLRYLSENKPRQALLTNLQMKLAPEMATIYE